MVNANRLVAICVVFGALFQARGALADTNFVTAGEAKVDAAGATSTSDFNPLLDSGLFTVKTASNDYVSGSAKRSISLHADAAVYAGDGIEPMAFTQIDYRRDGNWSGTTDFADKWSTAQIKWPHRIEALAGAPVNDPIPVVLDLRIAQQISDELSFASAGVCVYHYGYGHGCTAKYYNLYSQSWSTHFQEGQTSRVYNPDSTKFTLVPYVDHVTHSFKAFADREIIISVSAASFADLSGTVSASSAISIIDPLLMVDPAWEFAPLFRVVQRTSLANAVGIPVTRDWMAQPVPEPETYSMMLVGLGLLGFVSGRRKQKLNA